MAKLLQKECPSCGAPISVPKGVTQVKCGYCSTKVEVEWTRTAPPPQSAKPGTVYVSPGLPKAAIVGIVLGGIVPAAIPLAIAFGPKLEQAVVATSLSFPVVCQMNRELEITGKTFSGEGTLITLENNCKLIIKDSQLTGDVVVRGVLNNEITIQNSTLTGKAAALQLEGNAQVNALAGTVLTSDGIAVVAGTNVKLRLDNAKISSAGKGITGEVNTEVRATKSEIVARELALSFSQNGLVAGEGLTIRSEGAGIEAGGSFDLSGEGITLEAGDTALRSESNTKVKLGKKSVIRSTRGSGIHTVHNLQLTLDDSSIEAADAAVETGSNPHLRLVRDARLRGGSVALAAGENLELLLERARIESDGTAICGKHNLQLDLRNSVVTGSTWLLARRKPRLELVSTTTSGRQVFGDKPCRDGSPRPLPAAAPPRPTPAAVGRAASPASPAPAPAPAGPPPFDSQAAASALDAAARAASAQCRSSTGKGVKIWVTPGFSPDGLNRGATIDARFRGAPEGACIERIFRAVRIPPFDEKTRPGGLMRPVDVK